MKAFVEHQVVRGLGLKSMVILPIDNGSLLISVPYDPDNIYFGHLFAGDEWNPNTPTPDDGLAEIILPDFLGNELAANYKNGGRISMETANHLRELVIYHSSHNTSVQQTLEQIRQNDL